MAIGVLERKAGIAQFVDSKVRQKRVVDLMKRVRLYVDDELEALGYDQVRSRIRITLKNDQRIEGRYDVARGHPEKPMSWSELCEKFRDCTSLALSDDDAEQIIRLVGRLEKLKTLRPLMRALAGAKKGKKVAPQRGKREYHHEA
jgi:2-methylcitrate dehydratase PrpD